MPSREQLIAERIRIKTIVDEADRLCAGRPRFDLRRSVYGGVTKEQLVLEQTAWDHQHPVEAERWAFSQTQFARLEEIDRELDRLTTAARHYAHAVKALEVVPRVRAAVEAGLDETEATKALNDWDARPALWCCLIIGGVGAGKSTAAGAHVIAVGVREAECGEYSRRPVWVRAVEAARLSGFGDDAAERFAAWRRAPLLVLDDLGTEMLTPVWQQTLDDVLDHRYQHSLRTIITTNLKADDFKARYGERIADRIRQDGMVRELAASSLRRKSSTATKEAS